jgi:hypothetical protein
LPTLRRPSQVHEAEGKLSVLLGLPVDQAALGLDLSAQFRGISLAEAAEQVMDGRAEIGERQLEILRQHLDSASTPLDRAR